MTKLEKDKKKIEDLGYTVEKISPISLNVHYQNSIIFYYPYSEIFISKKIKEGKGINKLIEQIKDDEKQERAKA